jgi:hypothetical protein
MTKPTVFEVLTIEMNRGREKSGGTSVIDDPFTNSQFSRRTLKIKRRRTQIFISRDPSIESAREKECFRSRRDVPFTSLCMKCLHFLLNNSQNNDNSRKEIDQKGEKEKEKMKGHLKYSSILRDLQDTDRSLTSDNIR